MTHSGQETSIIDRIHCSTATQLLTILRASDRLWQPDPSHWVFRGQAKLWPLIPQALRGDILLGYGTSPTPLPDTRNQILSEFEVLRAFFLIADKQGALLPEDGHTMRTPEGWMKTIDPAIKDAMSGKAHWPPPELLNLFALAQHYGVPTRLLDWSEKPLVAAYFAALETAKSASEKSSVNGG